MDLSVYPKDREANIAYRKQVLAWCAGNAKRQAEIRERCRTDLLFFINVFGYLAEQRGDEATGHIVLPFVSYDFQDDALLRMAKALGKKHVVGDKSRDVGFTWMVLYLYLWRWLFYPGESFGVASRTQDLVDKPGSPDCHFWKLDFIIKHLPAFLLPKKKKRRKNHWANYDIATDITGYATDKDMLRGGRRTAIMLDEHAAFDRKAGRGSWAACVPATRSVFSVSTHQGTVGAFADNCRSAALYPHLFEHIVVRWWQDPRKNKGMCTVDPANPVPGMSDWTLQNRPGGRWTPWFEDQCRIFHYDQAMIAQELEGDPNASGHGFFSGAMLADVKKLCRNPVRVGRLLYDRETREPTTWIDDSNGNIKLWCDLIGGRPPIDSYAAGCDVSAGYGNSPSVIAVGSKTLGCKIAEFVDAFRKPPQFAADMVALAKWFNHAQLIWEAKGPGGTYINKLIVVEWEYSSVYFRRDNEGGLMEKPTAHVGWNPDREGKKTLLEVFREGLGTGEYLERSEAVIAECQDYRYSKDGGVEQAKSKETDDPTKAGTNHGDRVMATAMMWKIIKESRQLTPLVDRPDDDFSRKEAKQGSFAWFMQMELKAKQEAETFGGLQL